MTEALDKRVYDPEKALPEDARSTWSSQAGDPLPYLAGSERTEVCLDLMLELLERLEITSRYDPKDGQMPLQDTQVRCTPPSPPSPDGRVSGC